jgi:hypothetical protein
MTLKKLRFHLQLWDGIWSIPFMFGAFIFFGVVLQHFFPQAGFYDPSFLQAAVFATAVVLFMNTTIWVMIYLNWRHLWRYYKGRKLDDGQVVNQSKVDFENLKPWQRIGALLFMYCFSCSLWVVLFLTLK